MRRTSLLLASLLTMAPPALVGQGTPEAAAEAFGTAVIASDWPRAARFMHPEALRVLRGFLEPLVTSTEGAQLGTQLFGVKSAAELAATPDTVLFARFLANTMKEAAGAEVLSTAKIQALGHIEQPGDTVLVVSRLTLPLTPTAAITSYELVPMLLYQGQYRGLLKADMTNLLTMIQARFKRNS